MTITVPNQQYSFCPAPLTAPKQGFMYKNLNEAFFYDAGTGLSTQINDKDYPGAHTYTGLGLKSVGTVATASTPKQVVTSITSALGLATVTTPQPHNLVTGDSMAIAGAGGTALTVTELTQLSGTATALCAGHTFTNGQTVVMSGAAPVGYNGVKTLTGVVAGVSFSYALPSLTVSTPATLSWPAMAATETTPADPGRPITATAGAITPLSSLTQVGGVATAVTTTAHGFATGNVVAISGVGDAGTAFPAFPWPNTWDANRSPITPLIYGDAVLPNVNSFFLVGYAAPIAAVGESVTLSGSEVPVYNGIHSIIAIYSTPGSMAGTTLWSLQLSLPPSVPWNTPSPGLTTVYLSRASSSPVYNGYQSITVTSPTTFTFPVAADAPAIARGLPVATADYSAYNTLATVAVLSPTSFTYQVAGTPPATASGSALTFQTSHGLAFGDTVLVSGAAPSSYNGTFQITAASALDFTYNFAGGTSPATGTISAFGGQTTTPGLVSLDSYYIVMSTKGRLYVSDSGYPDRWSSLNYNMVQQAVGAGVALGKCGNYVIALKEWSTEVFYNAGRSPGSPLAPVLNGFSRIGCACGDSLAELEGSLFWISQTQQKGRAVHAMGGLQQQVVSTPDVDRILALSTLAHVYAYGVRISGHGFYVLTLTDLNITLVLDLTSKLWSTWSSLTPTTAAAISSMVIANGVATVVTAAPHGLADGDPTVIAGCAPATGVVNGQQGTTYINSTSFSFLTTATGAVTLTTPTSTGWFESYFKYTKYISALGKDLVQHETNGTLCELTEASFTDDGNPINTIIRTPIFDGGTTEKKFFGGLAVVGDKVAGTALLRYSGKDYASPVRYRPVNLNSEKARILRCGSDDRRSFELRYWGNTAFRASELEIEIEGGEA